VFVGHALVAVVAGEAPVLLYVDGQVLREVRLLGEALETSRLVANKRSFAGVNAQVIEKVMPLSEEHAALFVVALQDLDLAHRAWVLVFEDAELASIRYGLLNLDRAHVILRPLLYINFGVERDLFGHLGI